MAFTSSYMSIKHYLGHKELSLEAWLWLHKGIFLPTTTKHKFNLEVARTFKRMRRCDPEIKHHTYMCGDQKVTRYNVSVYPSSFFPILEVCLAKVHSYG